MRVVECIVHVQRRQDAILRSVREEHRRLRAHVGILVLQKADPVGHRRYVDAL